MSGSNSRSRSSAAVAALRAIIMISELRYSAQASRLTVPKLTTSSAITILAWTTVPGSSHTSAPAAMSSR